MKPDYLRTHGRKIPRKDAVDLLERVLYHGESSTDVLNERLSSYGAAQAKDAALLHALVMGVLRNLILLEKITETIASRPLKSMDHRLLLSLYTGIYQVFFMDRVPNHSAVDETVKVVKSFNRKAVSFANAVMRTVTREHERLVKGIKDRFVRFSMPQELLDALYRAKGTSLTDDELAILNLPAPTVMRVNIALIERDKLVEKLSGMGIFAEPIPWSRAAVSVSKGGSNVRDTGIVPRLMVPQDAASQVVVDILDPRPGERIVDLCAGRGIKTTQIQEYTDSRAMVTAVDLDEDKLRALRALMAQKGLDSITTITKDARKFRPSHPPDKVLLDAPCTGSGTLRRRPEVRYRNAFNDLKQLTDLQKQLLTNAFSMVKPGGMVVYAVCSILPQEGVEVWESVLAETPEMQDMDLTAKVPVFPAFTANGRVLTMPFRDDMDGFFIAAARKKEDGTATSVPG